MKRSHSVETKGIKRGVHYVPLGICDSPPVVEMEQEGEQVTFRVSSHYQYLRRVLTGNALKKLPGFRFW